MTVATAAIRPTVAYIDLDALQHNLSQVRKLAGSREIIAVVKADAYGHGAGPIARSLAANGVSRFGVALLEEARVLREAGLTQDVIVLGGCTEEQASEIVELGVTATIVHARLATALDTAARRAGRVAPVHVKIDTGMGRLGFSVDEAPEAVANVARLPGLQFAGLLTHFADADLADLSFAREQIARFDRVVAAIKARGVPIPLRHAANSAAVMVAGRSSASGLERALYDAVRPGIMLYGYRPGPAVTSEADLRPVLSLVTRVALLKRVTPGTSISYGRTFVARRPTVIAVLPIGYADGYRRFLSNTGHVLIRGRKAPIAGRVCMDLTMVDVTDVEGVSEGDEVVLIGAQGEATVTADDVATAGGTIAYEVLCGIGPRVPRRYSDSPLNRFEGTRPL